MAMDRTECRSCWDLGDLDSKRAKLAPDSRSVISQRNPNSLPFSWSPFTKWTVRPSGPSVDPISAGARRDFDRGEFGLAQLSHQRVLQLVADSCVTGQPKCGWTAFASIWRRSSPENPMASTKAATFLDACRQDPDVTRIS
jgi:hypothetical protein